MIHFILNQKEVKTDLLPGILLLDFIRYHQHLKGTKIGCREGDCGACTILVGEIKNEKLIYTSATSCLMALGNAQGKHIVTIEGINVHGLNAVQQAFSDAGATQCGFCTPGFMVALAGYCMDTKTPSYNQAVAAINGNICRCTGYKSIERATAVINQMMEQRSTKEPIAFAIDNNIIPSYFLGMKEKLLKIPRPLQESNSIATRFLGGGTDLYVQQHDSMPSEKIDFLFDKSNLKGITQNETQGELGAAVTVTDIAESPVFLTHFPSLAKYIRLISSTQIRNMATVAGNFTNASPIGDLTIFFLALDAQLTLARGTEKRVISLKEFYKGYKLLDKTPDEIIEKISFELPAANHLFNFEKVSKRTNLDIASVNTAIQLVMKGNTVSAAHLSAGGVGPIPTYLFKSSNFLIGKIISPATVKELLHLIQSEISPISDARGSEEYKRLLLTQLIKAHFATLFPTVLDDTFIKSIA